ncbi:ribonuclease H-like domain-containing protein [Tanacetum coccineum]
MASVSNTVSNLILIPDDKFLDDTPTKSVARTFLSEVKDTIVTLQRVVKPKMSLTISTSNLQTDLECTKEKLETCIIKKENEYALIWSKFTLSPLDVLQGFSFFLQMGFTLILATLDGLDVGLLGDVIVIMESLVKKKQKGLQNYRSLTILLDLKELRQDNADGEIIPLVNELSTDAKSLFEAIEARFGGNEATKKTQKTLLKQMYETFNASSSESLDSIFNRLQKIIVEPEVKRSVISSSNSGSQNLAFLSGHSSTKDVNTANVHVSTVYAYLATQPNGSQVVHKDLEQIHEDDLDEIDLKWQLALLSMKARKFYQRNGKKIIINGSDIAGYDKKKVECFNCYKLRHFARECRNPRSQENRNRSQDNSRRTVNVEESSFKAMLAIDGTVFYWSYMADDEASTNFALMAFSDSEVQNNKTCSKTCLKIFEDLKSRYDKLRIELNKSQSDLYSYKKGLASVEEQLVFYKKNEGMLCDQIAVLKSDASFNESFINALKKQVERLKKEKEDNQFKIDNFKNASKSLDQLIANQISDNNKKGLGYNAVAPSLTGLFAPPSIDLSNSGLEKFKQPEFEGYDVKTVVLEYLNIQKPKQADQPRKVSQNPRNNTVLTKSGLVPFSTVRQSFSRTTTPVSARSFKTAAPKPSVISVNTVKGKRMTSAVGEQRINAAETSQYSLEFLREIMSLETSLALAIPGQTETGKESSNPFMAGSLPKTIIPMIYLSQKSKVSHAQTLTMLMKKVKRLEDKLKMIFDSNEEDGNMVESTVLGVTEMEIA